MSMTKRFIEELEQQRLQQPEEIPKIHMASIYHQSFDERIDVGAFSTHEIAETKAKRFIEVRDLPLDCEILIQEKSL